MPLIITAASGQQGQPSRGLKKASSSKVKVRNQSAEYTAVVGVAVYLLSNNGAVLPSKIKTPSTVHCSRTNVWCIICTVHWQSLDHLYFASWSPSFRSRRALASAE